MPLIRWSHNPAIELLGVGNRLRLTIPLSCMRPDDTLIFQKVVYERDEILIHADILRKPFLSPYVDGQRFEPNDFFEQNFKRLVDDDNNRHPPQLS